MKQREIIIRILEQGGETPGYNLCKVDTPWGYLGNSGERTARAMAEEGLIERTYRKHNGKGNQYVYYRLKQPSVSPNQTRLETFLK